MTTIAMVTLKCHDHVTHRNITQNLHQIEFCMKQVQILWHIRTIVAKNVFICDDFESVVIVPIESKKGLLIYGP